MKIRIDMKNIATSKTAADLKVAGFPQPAPAPEQFWYKPNFGLFIVGPRLVGVDGLVKIFYLHTGKVYAKEESSFSECVFAPDVADIMAEMPDGYRLTRVNQDMFICTIKDPLLGTHGCDVNPAEAAALAYFKMKQK